MRKCPRCGKEHNATLLGEPSKFCSQCLARNLFDGMELETPPHLIDKFSKHPMLLPKPKKP